MFEMHPYCGPNIVDERDDPVSFDAHPAAFWEAVTFWAQQGQRVENGLCVWDRVFEPEPILKQVGKRTFLITGYKPARATERGK